MYKGEQQSYWNPSGGFYTKVPIDLLGQVLKIGQTMVEYHTCMESLQLAQWEKM